MKILRVIRRKIALIFLKVNDWNDMPKKYQRDFIKKYDIKCTWTHDITGRPRKGFGKLDDNGFWQYECK